MSSLNSQESSNDICRLTDKQQAEYRDAYREYISQMSQLEMAGSGAERPHPGQFAQAGSSEDKSVCGQPFFFFLSKKHYFCIWAMRLPREGVTSVAVAEKATVCLRSGTLSSPLAVC